jgi:predicted transcriptional regulator
MQSRLVRINDLEKGEAKNLWQYKKELSSLILKFHEGQINYVRPLGALAFLRSTSSSFPCF